MRKFISRFLPKKTLLLEFLIQFQMHQTNCSYENAKDKAVKFIEYKKNCFS